MPDMLETPILNDPYARALLCCGHVETDDEALLAVIAGLGNRQLVGRVGTDAEPQFLTVFGGGGGGPKHLHVNVATASYYAPKKPPEVNATANEVQRVLEQLRGQDIWVWIIGRFAVPLKELPKDGFIKTTRIRAEIGGLKIRQKSAGFSVEGGPIKAVNWSFERTAEGNYGTTVRVQMELTVETILDANYLKTLYATAFGAFRTVILGGDSSAGN